MEASEQQLPFDTESTVRAIGDRIVIEALTVTDERAARLVQDRAGAGQDPADTVAKAIEVGARVLDREGVEVEVGFVQAEFQRQAGTVAEQLTKALEAGDEQLAKRIADNFDSDRQGSVQQQIRELLGKALVEQREALARQFSAEDGANPLSDFKGAVVRALRESSETSKQQDLENRKRIEALAREVIELKERTAADQRVAEAEEAGTRKGRSFEALVHAGIERIADGRGDSATHTGDHGTESGSKKGDSVVDLGAADGPACGRIVFEVKNQKLSRQDAWRELDAALEQRDAGFAVLVVAGEAKVPARTEALQEYQGDKMIVAVDPDDPDGTQLEYAYRYARARLQMAGEQELSVDAAEVRAAAERARAQLKELQKARLSLTKISDGADSVRGVIDALDATIKIELDRIDKAVADA